MSRVDIDAIRESLIRRAPYFFLLLALMAVGLLLTDGASWVTVVGFCIGGPIMVRLGWRELDRYHARQSQEEASRP